MTHMTQARERLPNRRASETFELRAAGMDYRATVSRYTDADGAARASAVVASLALQHGVPLDTIRHAILRDTGGQASGPLGTALDLLAEGGVP
jgi:ribonucleoside-diphosphate reductase alpha chain